MFEYGYQLDIHTFFKANGKFFNSFIRNVMTIKFVNVYKYSDERNEKFKHLYREYESQKELTFYFLDFLQIWWMHQLPQTCLRIFILT